ncbi:hypothetical protein BAC1_00607 [uncultured bacterium]|nr:hypothetical protein BAC1_00607 [uncultured bacterium]
MSIVIEAIHGKSDRNVIEAFIVFLRRNGYPSLYIEEWPEDRNRNLREIDAIAGRFAIEHTSIDTIREQRRNSDWFMKAIGSLKEELEKKIFFRLTITIAHDAVSKGQRWKEIHKAIKNYILDTVPSLSDGQHTIDKIADVPFPLQITKASHRPPGIFIYRTVPSDETLPVRIKALFDDKAKKLERYKIENFTTVLLVENNDLALMNDSIMYESIKNAYPAGIPTSVDQLWYADTSLPRNVEFKLYSGI